MTFILARPGTLYMFPHFLASNFDTKNTFQLFIAECAEELLKNSLVDLNAQNKLGDSALHAAAWKGHAEIIELLLEKGAMLCLHIPIPDIPSTHTRFLTHRCQCVIKKQR